MHSGLKLFLALICAIVPCLATPAADMPLVSHGDTWRYRPALSAPPANWHTMADAALDGSWLSGAGGFGYGDPGISGEATTLNTMSNSYRSLTIRRTFNLPAPVDPDNHLLLRMDWDDGFVVYLDGVPLLTNNAPANLAYDVGAPATHEASCCNAPTNPARTFDLGPVLDRLAAGSHILAVHGWNQSITSSDFHLIADLLHGSPPPPATNSVSGIVAADTTWYAVSNFYTVVGNVTVASGVTLTIEPGVEVRFNPGLGMIINGRLLAEGTPEHKIVFTRNAASGTWNQLAFTANATTSRIAHAEMDYFAAPAIEATGTTLYLDSITWTNSTVAAVDVHTCSITLLNSYIPGGAGNEPVHFSTMPLNGHALIKGCIFGAPRGYNDSIDFTGGNRPGPIVQFIDNIFLAGVDDCFDMDATDAHIEGNIFLNVLQDDERESSSNPISTGEGSSTSELTICRNIFFNCEHTVLLKDGGATVMQNNTIVHLVTNALARTAAFPGGQAIPPGIILFGEPWRTGRTPGTGAYFEGNIAFDLHPLIQANPFPLYDPADSFFFVSRSLIQGNNWPGVGNLSGDPLFVNPTGPMTAQTIRSNLALLAGSPCLGTGPNGLDMGALVPSGASISGAPAGMTTNPSASLRVAGPGVVAFRWKLNEDPWSQEIPLTNTVLFTTNYFNPTNGLVALHGLTNGSYTFQAIGKNSAGFWQETNAAAARTWTVSTSAPFRIENASRNGDIVTFAFIAQAGVSYRVLYRDALDAAHPWIKLEDVPAQGSTGPYTVTDDTATPLTRFYQIVTP